MERDEWKDHPQKDPWALPHFSDDVVYAMRALHSGTANAGQQRTVWEWLEHAAGYRDVSFRPGGLEGQRATDFAEGKRWLVAQMFLLLHPKLTPKPKPQKDHR